MSADRSIFLLSLRSFVFMGGEGEDEGAEKECCILSLLPPVSLTSFFV